MTGKYGRRKHEVERDSDAFYARYLERVEARSLAAHLLDSGATWKQVRAETGLWSLEGDTSPRPRCMAEVEHIRYVDSVRCETFSVQCANPAFGDGDYCKKHREAP